MDNENKKVFTVDARYAFRIDELSEWERINPVLAEGEPGIVSDKLPDESGEWLKIGDGQTAFMNLPWAKGPTGAKGAKGDDFTYDMFTEEQLALLSGSAAKEVKENLETNTEFVFYGGDAARTSGILKESTEYPGCYYHVVDGEEEWLNPPMGSGSFRTFERWNGKPVYTLTLFDDDFIGEMTMNAILRGRTIKKFNLIRAESVVGNTTLPYLYYDNDTKTIDLTKSTVVEYSYDSSTKYFTATFSGPIFSEPKRVSFQIWYTID